MNRERSIPFTYILLPVALFMVMIAAHGCLDKADLSEVEVEQKVFQLVNEYRVGLA